MLLLRCKTLVLHTQTINWTKGSVFPGLQTPPVETLRPRESKEEAEETTVGSEHWTFSYNETDLCCRLQIERKTRKSLRWVVCRLWADYAYEKIDLKRRVHGAVAIGFALHWHCYWTLLPSDEKRINQFMQISIQAKRRNRCEIMWIL